MKLSAFFTVGGHLALFDFEDEAGMRSGYLGVIASVDDARDVVRAVKDGNKRAYVSSSVVEINDPGSGDADAGLPVDAEVWEERHRVIFLQRGLDFARRGEAVATPASVREAVKRHVLAGNETTGAAYEWREESQLVTVSPDLTVCVYEDGIIGVYGTATPKFEDLHLADICALFAQIHG